MVYRKFHDAAHINLKQILLVVSSYSFVAGHINALFFLLHSIPVSHMTGNLTHLGDILTDRGLAVPFTFLVVVLSFLCGSIVSGFVLEGPVFAPDRKYGLLTILEGCLILLAAVLGIEHFWMTLLLCSFAMGLQNAFISSYKGIIIRTTHMTGIVTDLGFMLGSSMRAKKIPIDKLAFFLFILFAFVAGAISGYWCERHFQFRSLYIIAFFLLISGSYYLVRRLAGHKH